MNCRNKIIEYNLERPCWLPRNPSSPFDFCSRCTYYKLEDILKTVKKEDLTSEVQALCVDIKHFDSLQWALYTLLKQKDPLFESFYKTCMKSKDIATRLEKQMIKHTPCSLCGLYQTCLKRRVLGREPVITDIPWDCQNCVAYILRDKTALGLMPTFTRGILTATISYKLVLQWDVQTLIDTMVSLHLKQKPHTGRLLFERYRAVTNDWDKSKKALELFLFQPAMISSLFDKSYEDYYPYEWRATTPIATLQKQALQYVRKRNWVFKEELIMRTWAPHRLFAWCLDIEDLKDFAE
jgi:hypothetical protein